jgi:hypothetical protein
LLVVLGSLVHVSAGAAAVAVIAAVAVALLVLARVQVRITARAVVAAVSAGVFALAMAGATSVVVLGVRGVRTTATIVDSIPVHERHNDYLPVVGACYHLRLLDGTPLRGEICEVWKDNRPATHGIGDQIEVVADPGGWADAQVVSGFHRALWLALVISGVSLVVTVVLAWFAGQPVKVPADRMSASAAGQVRAPHRYRKHKRPRRHAGPAYPTARTNSYAGRPDP